MKIAYTYTVQEAENALQEFSKTHTNTNISVKIEVPAVPDTTRRPSIMEAVNLIRSFHHKGDQKISAIQAYREWAQTHGLDSGLGEAKYFVESIS